MAEKGGQREKMVFTTIIPPSTHLYFRKSLPTARPRIRCSSNTSSIATAFDLKTYCSTLREKINQKPEEIVPVQYPQLIYEAMRYSVLAKGAKRAPPVMCISACEFLGGNRLAAFPTACALKMEEENYFWMEGNSHDINFTFLSKSVSNFFIRISNFVSITASFLKRSCFSNCFRLLKELFVVIMVEDGKGDKYLMDTDSLVSGAFPFPCFVSGSVTVVPNLRVQVVLMGLVK